MKLDENDFAKNSKDIVANYERKKTIITRKIEESDDSEAIINYLHQLSKSLAEESKWYTIATDIMQLYEKKILVSKSQTVSLFHPNIATQEIVPKDNFSYESPFSNKEQKLVSILFRASMEAKREKVAKKLLELSENNGFEIEDEKDYKFKLRKKNGKTRTAQIIRFAVVMVFFIISMAVGNKNEIFIYSFVVLFAAVEAALYLYNRNKNFQ